MPIWLRNYTYSLISDHYENEKKEYDKETNSGNTNIDLNQSSKKRS